MSKKRGRRVPKNPYSMEQPLALEGQLVRLAQRPVRTGRAARLGLRFIHLLPSARDSQRGRANATQLKILLVGFGLLLGAIGKTTTHMVIGALFMVSALCFPVSEWRKRMWRARLKSTSTRVERVEVPVEVRYDVRRVAVLEGEKVWRRVLVDRGVHRTLVAAEPGITWFGIVPASGRKAESLWFQAPVAPPAGVPPFQPERVDASVVMTPAALEKLQDILYRWSVASD